MDIAFLSAKVHRDSPRLAVSSHPYIGSNRATRRVEKEILGASDEMRHCLRYEWNRSVDEVLSANRDALLVHTQIVGGCVAYLGWYRFGFILVQVEA